MSISSNRTLPTLAIFVLGFLLAGCGSSGHTFCAAGSIGSGCGCGLPCPISPGPEFLYATSINNGGEILTFTIDHKTGALGAPASIAGPVAAVGITSAKNEFLYVSDVQHGAIDAFSINQTSGALTMVPGSPFSPGGMTPFLPLALVAGSSDLYVTGTGVTGFTIGANGALTEIVGSPFSGGVAGQAALGQSNTTPPNTFLFATNFLDPNGTISVFTVDSAGILTAVPGNFSTGAGSNPDGIVFDGAFSTPYVFVALNGTNEIAAFSVDLTTGALTAVGSPVASGLQPTFLALNSAGNVLYAMNFGDGTISAYTVASSGTLTQINGSPFTAGAHPGSIVVTQDNFLYVTLPAADGILGFSINGDGSLTKLAGSPFPGNGAILLSVVQIPPS